MKNSLKGNLLLLLTALIWGLAFVAQSSGMAYVGPFTFQSLRCLLGAAVLLPLIMIRGKSSNQGLWKAGLIVGSIFFLACNIQQFGIACTTVGKAGFLTAMYILFVPLLKLLKGEKVAGQLWLCIVLGVVGLYFLCVNEGFSVSFGDLLCLLCALFFAFHILAVEHFVLIDGVKLSAIQFLVNGVLSGVMMLIFEKPELSAISMASLEIFYAGVMSCGVAYTLQIIAQRYTDGVIASLIMSLESVFAVLGGVVLLKQVPGSRELIGIGFMFVAIILSQLRFNNGKN